MIHLSVIIYDKLTNWQAVEPRWFQYLYWKKKKKKLRLDRVGAILIQDCAMYNTKYTHLLR